MYFKYKCLDCGSKWEGKKQGSRCTKCKSVNLKVKVNDARYELLDKAAENYAKKTEVSYNSKK